MLCNPENPHIVNKHFWLFIKKVKRDPCGVSSLLSNNFYVSDALAKVNIPSPHHLTEENDTIPDEGPSPFLIMPCINNDMQGV